MKNLLTLASEQVKNHFRNHHLHSDVFLEIGKGSPFALAEKEMIAFLEDERGINSINDVIESKGEARAVTLLANNWKLLILQRLEYYAKN